MNSFELSRNWFNFSFENIDKIKPAHTAIYFFAIEHCNRLGGKEKFGFPTTMAMEAIGIKKYDTYIKCFRDLVDWGFIKLIEKSKNQFSSNIIALPEKGKARGKALDKAMVKHGVNHGVKQGESTGQSMGKSMGKSMVSIIKQETNKPETIKQYDFILPEFLESFLLWMEYKKERKEGYKGEKSQKAFYNKLVKLSNNNPMIAAEIVEQSMASNWAGIFELKNQSNGTNQQNNGNNKLKPFEKFPEEKVPGNRN